MLMPLAAVVGVALIASSFAINPGPASGATLDELRVFGLVHRSSILWGAWLQAVGTVLLAGCAIALAERAGAVRSVTGALVLLGACTIVTVSLIEVTLYMSALSDAPTDIALVSTAAIHAVQHLYFIVAAPAVFLSLGVAIVRSATLPRALGYCALLLAVAFFAIGAGTLTVLVLPPAVTSLASVQALWWLAAAAAYALMPLPLDSDECSRTTLAHSRSGS